jgi:hypothetical protein
MGFLYSRGDFSFWLRYRERVQFLSTILRCLWQFLLYLLSYWGLKKSIQGMHPLKHFSLLVSRLMWSKTHPLAFEFINSCTRILSRGSQSYFSFFLVYLSVKVIQFWERMLQKVMSPNEKLIDYVPGKSWDKALESNKLTACVCIDFFNFMSRVDFRLSE